MTLERAIEYLEAVKKEYPSEEVHDACNIAIATLNRQLGNEVVNNNE